MRSYFRTFLEIGCLLIAATALGYYTLKPAQSNPSKPALSSYNTPSGDITLGELRVHKSDKSYPGFTLLPANGSAKVFLLNTKGEIVHHWGFDADRARLLPNCNILVVHGSKWGLKVEPWKSLRPTVREYNWEGETVWEYTAADVAHHDITRLANGNTLFPVRQIVPKEFKSKILDPTRRALKIRSDVLTEVNPAGEIVWQWPAHKYLDLNSCGKLDCSIPRGGKEPSKKLSDWTHINTSSVIPENKWFDGGDARFKPGNIITLPRNWWTTFIIDKESKEVVWRYEGDYRGGLSGGHDAHIIPKGLPGAGNMLIFDNGRKLHAGESIVLEINPSTKELVWLYENSRSFFSKSAGSVQRLPNGNTLISEDVPGRVFEVTPQKEIVWEFVGPQRISRARRYEVSYCEKLSS